jgi:hypothetical protein
MRPIRIALICVLAACAASAGHAQGDDFQHWKPGQKTLAKLDFAFRNDAQWHGSPPDFAKYDRYYEGVTVKGRRMVRAEFSTIPGTPINCRPAVIENGHSIPQICLIDHSHDRTPEVHIVPEDQFPSVKGGGCSFVNMLYDVDADRMAEFWCNAPE